MSVVEMTSSSMITGDAFECVEFSSDSDTDSWQVVDDPFDSDNDVVITTESDVITSDEDEDEDEDEPEDEDEDVVFDDVIDDEDDEDDDSVYDDEDDEDDDSVYDDEDAEEEEDDDDVITYVDEITNHTQELNEVYETDDKAAVELVSLINGEGGEYKVEMSDLMKEDLYMKQIVMERMLMERNVVEEEDEDEDEDDEYDDEDDLDDELVPRWLNNKFERQRMRKLGKKVHPKMKKSKRMVNQYNRPGCAGAKFQMW